MYFYFYGFAALGKYNSVRYASKQLVSDHRISLNGVQGLERVANYCNDSFLR